MAERLHVQHYHSTGGTTPTAANLKDGEIAVGLKAGEEKLFIKNTTGGVVEFVTKKASDDAYIKNNGITSLGDAEGGIEITGSTIDIYEGADVGVYISDDGDEEMVQLYVYGNTLEVNQNNVTVGVGTGKTVFTKDNITINDKNVLTSETYKGTVTGVTAGSGLTGGGSAVTGSTGLTINVNAGNGIAISNDKVTVKAGTGITVDASGVSISSAYRDDIAKGVSAYTEFNAFMTGVNDKDEVINTLTEIQEYIKNDYDGYISLLNDVTEAKKYNGTITGVTAGSGLTGGGSASTGGINLEIAHGETSDVSTGIIFGPSSNVTGTNGTTVVIPNFEVDEFGHVISAGTITYTSKDTDTHHTGATVVCASSTGKTNAGALNKSVHLNFIENNTVRSSHNIKGTGIATVTADTSGNIVVHVPDTNTDSATTENGHYTPSSSASTVSASSGKYVSGVKLDSKKHVVGVTEGTLPTFTETYKGTITGITAGDGLTGGGNKFTGSTGLTLSLNYNDNYFIINDGVLELKSSESTLTENSGAIENTNEKSFAIITDIETDELGRIVNYTKTSITNINCGTW